MTPSDLERVYGALAEHIDAVGPAKSELFLSKLALLTAREIGDARRVLTLLDEARLNIDAAD